VDEPNVDPSDIIVWRQWCCRYALVADHIAWNRSLRGRYRENSPSIGGFLLAVQSANRNIARHRILPRTEQLRGTNAQQSATACHAVHYCGAGSIVWSSKGRLPRSGRARVS